MKKLCLIASYGGSGSTYLTHLIQNKFPEYNCYHTHSLPEIDANRIGVPIFNKFTKHHVEGPFSRDFDLPKTSKIVFIYRNPSEAYLSRCCFKQFVHIWSETDYFYSVVGEEPSEEKFIKEWEVKLSKKEDILNLSNYFSAWQCFAEKQIYDVAFVKYEELDKAWPKLFEFLGGKDEDFEPLIDFVPARRATPEPISEIYCDLNKIMKALPYIQTFKMQDTPLEWSKPDFKARKRLLNFSVTIASVDAGVSDAISRIGLAYDVIKTVFDVDVSIESYSNYHSEEIDFFEFFGIKNAFTIVEPVEEGTSDTIRTKSLRLSDFIYYALHNLDFFKENEHYRIVPDVYQNDVRLGVFRSYLGLNESFFNKLSYTPTAHYFPYQSSSKKVVIHLRRSDICGNQLREAEPELPEKMLDRIQSRRVLLLAEALREVAARYERVSSVDIIVLSDGLAELHERFKDFPRVIAKLSEMEKELMSDPKDSCSENMTIVKRFIGKDKSATLASFDCMNEADLVITASSSFPTLISKINGVRVVWL